MKMKRSILKGRKATGKKILSRRKVTSRKVIVTMNVSKGRRGRSRREKTRGRKYRKKKKNKQDRSSKTEITTGRKNMPGRRWNIKQGRTSRHREITVEQEEHIEKEKQN